MPLKVGKHELKACPFCGEEAALLDSRVHPYVHVRCLTCHIATDWFVHPEKAVRAWNRRTKDLSHVCPRCNGSGHTKECRCDGEGWLWGSELYNPSEDTINDTMTKYTCNRDDNICVLCNGTGVYKYADTKS